MTEMQRKLKKYTVKHWANSFIQQQMRVKKFQEDRETKLLQEGGRARLLEDYKNARSRLLLLDYDGTLVGFKNDPNAASPDDGVVGDYGKTSVSNWVHVL